MNSIFKCWSRFKFCSFNTAVPSKRIRILIKGCGNFINNELWWKLDWYFIDNFSSFWEVRCFLVNSNKFFFDVFWLLVLLFCEIRQFLFWLFEDLIRFIKLGLEFGLKAIFRRWGFRSESKHLILNVLLWEIV